MSSFCSRDEDIISNSRIYFGFMYEGDDERKNLQNWIERKGRKLEQGRRVKKFQYYFILFQKFAFFPYKKGIPNVSDEI